MDKTYFIMISYTIFRIFIENYHLHITQTEITEYKQIYIKKNLDDVQKEIWNDRQNLLN